MQALNLGMPMKIHQVQTRPCFRFLFNIQHFISFIGYVHTMDSIARLKGTLPYRLMLYKLQMSDSWAYDEPRFLALNLTLFTKKWYRV